MMNQRKDDGTLNWARRARLFTSGRAKLEGISTVSGVNMPTTRAMDRIKTFFNTSYNKYQLFRQLELLDSDLQSGYNTAAMIVDRSMHGFRINPGESQDEREEELEKELNKFWKKMKPYVYDIAYKVLRDGDACYVIDKKKTVGIRELVWLPVDRLTILDSKADRTMTRITAQHGEFYCLNEIPFTSTDDPEAKTQWFPKSQVAHFNWGRKEKVLDINNRTTFNIWTTPPTEALSVKLIWKLSLILNDMMMREVLVPREHHKLPSAAFNPDFFQGENQESRITAAQAAAQSVLSSYAKGLEGRRVDRGYVTLDNVEVGVVEPKVKYTAPNEHIDQIDKSINRSIGIPESAMSGEGGRRGSFASEVAIGAYLVVKAEKVAELVSNEMTRLAKLHIDVVKPGYQDLYDNIEFKLQLLFFRAEVARMMAILAELECFTQDEIRDMFGYLPLREDQEVLRLNRGFTQTPGQMRDSQQNADDPVQSPRTEQSIQQTQKT